MQSNPAALKIDTSVQSKPTQPTNVGQTNAVSIALVNEFVALSVIAFLMVIVCVIVGYRKHRARAVQWQIQHLNRVWQLDSSEKLP